MRVLTHFLMSPQMPTQPSHLPVVCAQQVGAKTVKLSVRGDHPSWRWEVQFAEGQTLEAGTATTRFAGQLAAQHAFELRLKRAGLDRRNFSGYRWTNEVG